MTFVLSYARFYVFQVFYNDHVSLLYLEEKINTIFFRENCDVTGAIIDVACYRAERGEQ